MTVMPLRTEPSSSHQPSASHDPSVAHARSLHRRALSLRTQANHVDAVLATTYRRRASELELEAFLVALQSNGADAVTGLPAA
jgi:hypothetical protein